MRRKTIGLLAAAVLSLLAAAGAYAAIGTYYQTHFLEHVFINGIDVAGLTAAEAEELIARQAEDYRLAVVTRGGAQELIEGAQIDYRCNAGSEVEALLQEQDWLAWLPAYVGQGVQHTMETPMTFDAEKLSQAAGALSCMQKDQTTAPVDAHLAQQEDGTYVVVPEVEGNRLRKKKVIAQLTEAVRTGQTSVNLEETGCYKEPKVRADEALKARAAVMNRYTSVTVTYQMGGGVTEVLDRATTSGWFSLDENGQPSFDRDAVAAWVNQLADRYDTIGTYPPFVTSNGETVYPEARTYGWQMDRSAETEALYQILMAGSSTERSPVWLEGAQTRGENDIGNTYVEIDYTNQRMWYYKDGVLLVETPVVTGNVSAGTPSPEGIFCIVGKEENAILKGEGYERPVAYWMPFYEGVGIHDADEWRSSYGGQIYQWSGSHGCINTPTAQASIIFQNIEVGTPVICYSSATYYGYSEVSGGQTTGGVSGDGNIIIYGDGTSGDASGQYDGDGLGDWADESTYSGAGQADFPITIQDEWSQ